MCVTFTFQIEVNFSCLWHVTGAFLKIYVCVLHYNKHQTVKVYPVVLNVLVTEPVSETSEASCVRLHWTDFPLTPCADTGPLQILVFELNQIIL